MTIRPTAERLAARTALGLLIFAAAIAPAAARDFFNPDNSFLTLDSPIFLNETGFSARIDRVRENHPPVGLVLSGGSARALAHIGALVALEEHGIRPDFIVANSMGSIVAILYAAGIAPEDMRRLFESIPINELFDPNFPTSGGILDTGRFADMLRRLLAFKDISDFPTPLLLICEDIQSRRRVLIAEGEAATVATASFALPVIFSPVVWNGMRLIDGGVTNLVPTETAEDYSDNVIVSTSIYSRELNLTNPVVILNRTLDLVKTRRAVTELKYYRPALIRCDVEDVSYMAFDGVSEIIDAGYRSAIEAMDSVLEAAAPVAGASLSPELSRARKLHSERVSRILAEQVRGVVYPRSEPRVAWLPAVRLFDPAGGFGDASRGRYEAGLRAKWNSGYWSGEAAGFVRWDGGSRNGEDGAQRAGNAVMALEATWTPRGNGELRLRAEAEGLAQDLAEGTGARTLLFGAAAGTNLFLGPNLIASPNANGEALVYVGPDADARTPPAVAEAALALHGTPLAPGKRGGAFLLSAGGFSDGEGNFGPIWTASAETPLVGPVGLRLRAKGRYSALGEGTAYRSSDAYRGPGGDESGFGSEDAVFGTAPLRMVANAGLDFDAPFLRLDLAESLSIRKASAGLFADAAFAVRNGAPERRVAVGIAGEFSVSAFGLLPLDLSVHAARDIESGEWSLGVYSGFLFRDEEKR